MPHSRIALLLLAVLLCGLTGLPVDASAASAPAPRIAGCRIFPPDNVWNRRIDGLPVRSDSETLKGSIGLGAYLHPDFGSYAGYGIPWNVVRGSTPRVDVTFRWPAESDPGPYPIPAEPRMEGGSDRHILLLDRDRCRLLELFAAERQAGRWRAGSGAIWDLGSNAPGVGAEGSVHLISAGRGGQRVSGVTEAECGTRNIRPRRVREADEHLCTEAFADIQGDRFGQSDNGMTIGVRRAWRKAKNPAGAPTVEGRVGDNCQAIGGKRTPSSAFGIEAAGETAVAQGVPNKDGALPGKREGSMGLGLGTVAGFPG